jgi:putative Mg2+ transporter-C (MgtC) family protein
LTTAAGIWLTAAIGVAVGLGRGATAVLATTLAFLVLWLLPTFEHHPDSEDVARHPPEDAPVKAAKKTGGKK